ncbi:kinesin-like protein KIF9 isoform X2 [Cebus imitator]|uniref:kinesin-like protein KIF9 isoform X2 n=1 Tax=Cebus imitator TaxID=2715852 RepID=UPI001897736F|nr:kinesin-like protein KIF9 isoform X2 [Cebus imitator]
MATVYTASQPRVGSAGGFGCSFASWERPCLVNARMGTRKKVHAFVRVKPTDDFAHEMIRYGDDNKTIDIHLKKDIRRGVVNNQQTDWSFKLDGVLHNASQDLVYETVAKDVVSQALDGYNGNLIN